MKVKHFFVKYSTYLIQIDLPRKSKRKNSVTFIEVHLKAELYLLLHMFHYGCYFQCIPNLFFYEMRHKKSN